VTREPYRRIVMLGPPGAGKGTQAKLLAETMELKHIASGDLFRQHQADGTILGMQAKDYYIDGLLVPDEITISMVLPDVLAISGGFVLDGFPRNINQAEHLESALSEVSLQIDQALLIAVPKEEMLKRLTGRRVCNQCDTPFHLITAPSTVDGICNVCGGQLYQRDDDKPEAIDTRLEEYHSQTKPVAGFYRNQRKLTELDGVGAVEGIFQRLLQALCYEGFERSYVN